MSDKQKHLDFLKDLRELMKKHEVEEFYFCDDALWVEFKTPIDDIDFWSAIDEECLDTKIKNLEEHIQDVSKRIRGLPTSGIQIDDAAFAPIPEVWGNSVQCNNESVLGKMMTRTAVANIERAITDDTGPIRKFFQDWVSRIKASPEPKHYGMRLGDFLDAMEAEGGATNVPQIRAEVIRKMGPGFFDTLVWITSAGHEIVEEDKEKVREKIVQASGKSIPMEFTLQFSPVTQVNNNEPT